MNFNLKTMKWNPTHPFLVSDCRDGKLQRDYLCSAEAVLEPIAPNKMAWIVKNNPCCDGYKFGKFFKVLCLRDGQPMTKSLLDAIESNLP